MRRSLLLSLSLHLILLGALQLWHRSRGSIGLGVSRLDQNPPAPLDLVFWRAPISPKNPLRSIQPRRPGGHKAVSSSPRRGFKLQELNPNSMEVLSQGKVFESYNHGGSNLAQADNRRAPWGEGGSEFARLADAHLMSLSSARLSGMIGYPGPFIHRKISGVIRARLVIESAGKCKWSDSFVQGNNPYLRFYVLTVLKQYCRHDAWRELPKRSSANLDFSFDFNLSSKKDFSITNNGNVFLVHIPGHQPKGTWFWGPLAGNYLVPNFVALNPQWIVENWNKLMYDEDPMARFREPE